MKVIITGNLAEIAGGNELYFSAGREGDKISLRIFFEEILFSEFPALKPRIVNESGNLRPHIAVFAGDARIGGIDDFVVIGSQTEIYILPALSGG